MLVLLGSGVVPLSAPSPAEATAPVFAFGIGTNGIDRGFGIDTDASGNVYAAGSYGTTADFDPGPGVTSFTSNGSDDVWVAKYTPAGALVWVKSFGAGSVDNPTGLVVDATGVYVSGFFSGTVNFGLGDLQSAGNSDAFVIKLSLTDGSTIWQKRFGNPQLDRAQGIAVSGNGVYVIGRFQGTTDFGGGNRVSAGGDDIFVLRLNASDGSHVWSVRFGGPDPDPGQDIGLGIASDGAGVYVTGLVTEAVSFGGAALPPLGREDIFIARLNAANGSHVWSKRFGAAENDRGSAVAVDGTGVYVTGRFRRTLTFGGGNLSSGGNDSGNEDVFVVKLALGNGNHIWSERFGDVNNDRGDAITLGGNDVFVTGRYQGTVDFGTTLTSAGSPASGDVFVAALATNDGTPELAYSLGGPAQDEGFAIAVSGKTVLTAGEFAETADFGAGVTTLNLTSGGSQDAFVSQVNIANASPRINAPPNAVAQTNVPLTFGSASANQISVSDADAGAQPVQLQLVASNARVTLANAAGLTFTVGDGTADGTMTFTGTLASVNTGLNGLVFTPDSGFSGLASLTLNLSDQGATGLGGPKTDNQVIPIPVITQCSPRPRVVLQTTQIGSGQLQTVVTVTTSSSTSTNSLYQLQLKTAENARVDVLNVPGGPTNSAGNVNVSLPAGTTAAAIVVRRQGPGPFRVPFTVVDICGYFPTFVGGGTGVS